MGEPLNWRAGGLVLAMWAVMVLGFVAVAHGAPPCEKAYAITVHDPAVPCVGMLVPDADHERALRCIREQLPGCRALLGKVTQELEVERRGRRQDRVRFDRKIADYKQTARKAVGITRPPWERPGYCFVMGLGFGLAAGAATTYAIMRIRASE